MNMNSNRKSRLKGPHLVVILLAIASLVMASTHSPISAWNPDAVRCTEIPSKAEPEKSLSIQLPAGTCLWGCESHPMGKEGPALIQIIAADEKTIGEIVPPKNLGIESLKKLDNEWTRYVFFRTADLVGNSASLPRFVLAFTSQTLSLANMLVPPTSPGVKALTSCVAFAFDLGLYSIPEVALPVRILSEALSVVGDVGNYREGVDCLAHLADWYNYTDNETKKAEEVAKRAAELRAAERKEKLTGLETRLQAEINNQTVTNQPGPANVGVIRGPQQAPEHPGDFPNPGLYPSTGTPGTGAEVPGNTIYYNQNP